MPQLGYFADMRVFEVILRSGAKAQVTAESFDDQCAHDSRIYFYRDKGLKQVVAYFNSEEVVGVVFGPDHANMQPRTK